MLLNVLCVDLFVESLFSDRIETLSENCRFFKDKSKEQNITNVEIQMAEIKMCAVNEQNQKS